MAERPIRVFIGSSKEGLPFAFALQAVLDRQRGDVEVNQWSADGFTLGQTNIENLIDNSAGCDYAILIVTPDDVLDRRGEVLSAPRDNIVFEIGLFIGALGRHRTVILRDQRVSLPSDLGGIKVAEFRATQHDGNMRTATQAIGGAMAELLDFLVKPKGRDRGLPRPRWTAAGIAGRHLEVFRCTPTGLEHRWFDYQWEDRDRDESQRVQRWSGWNDFSPAPPEPPVDVAACARPDGSRLDLFTVGADRRVAHLAWTASDHWSARWEVFEGEVTEPIAAASFGVDHAEIYARRRSDGRTVSRYMPLHGDQDEWWPKEGWDVLWMGPTLDVDEPDATRLQNLAAGQRHER